MQTQKTVEYDVKMLLQTVLDTMKRGVYNVKI